MAPGRAPSARGWSFSPPGAAFGGSYFCRCRLDDGSERIDRAVCSAENLGKTKFAKLIATPKKEGFQVGHRVRRIARASPHSSKGDDTGDLVTYA